MFEFRAGSFVVPNFVVTSVDDDVADFVDDSVDVSDTFCDGDACGVLTVELSIGVDVSGGRPDDLCGVVVDGVTKIVVEVGVGAAENGFGTRDSTTPTGPSNPMSVSGHANSSG